MRLNNLPWRMALVVFLGMNSLLSGCAAPGPRVEGDPWEGFNRGVYGFNKTLDETIVKPIATGYKNAVPAPVNKGVTNFFNNIDDVIVAINQLLQGKPEKALMDTSRVVWNTTVGLLGFIDVATHMDLPKHTEDFGQTMGVWGYTPGPYLVLPVLGPSTARDTVGLIPDWFLFDPINYTDASLIQRLGLTAVKYIDIRADLLGASEIVDTAALDEYTFIRDAYLQRRRYLIYDGDPPAEDWEEEFFDDEEPPPDEGETESPGDAG